MNKTSNNCSNNEDDHAPLTVPQPENDAFFNFDNRVIEDLLEDQNRYYTPPWFIAGENFKNALWMRRTLINWIREVCDHRHSPTEVLAHTVQLIDHFVKKERTTKAEYQLVGAACLLISSKIKETYPVAVDNLTRYTDYSVTKDELLCKELHVMITLDCDFAMITATDFIKPIVDRFFLLADLNKLIRESAYTVYRKVVHVEGLNYFLPSYVASACILFVAQNITSGLVEKMRSICIDLLRLDAVKLDETLKFFQSLFEPGTVDLSEEVKAIDRGEGTTPDGVPDDSPEASSSYHSIGSSSSGPGIDSDSIYQEHTVLEGGVDLPSLSSDNGTEALF